MLAIQSGHDHYRRREHLHRLRQCDRAPLLEPLERRHARAARSVAPSEHRATAAARDPSRAGATGPAPRSGLGRSAAPRDDRPPRPRTAPWRRSPACLQPGTKHQLPGCGMRDPPSLWIARRHVQTPLTHSVRQPPRTCMANAGVALADIVHTRQPDQQRPPGRITPWQAPLIRSRTDPAATRPTAGPPPPQRHQVAQRHATSRRRCSTTWPTHILLPRTASAAPTRASSHASGPRQQRHSSINSCHPRLLSVSRGYVAPMTVGHSCRSPGPPVPTG